MAYRSPSLHPLDEQGNTASETRSRRSMTLVACNACQRRKCKCDGVRPTCGKCLSQSKRCEYDAASGLTRSQQLLNDQHRLEQQLDSFGEIYEYLQTRDLEDAHALFLRIRSGDCLETTLGLVKSEQTQGVRDQHRAEDVSLLAREGINAHNHLSEDVLLSLETSDTMILAFHGGIDFYFKHLGNIYPIFTRDELTEILDDFIRPQEENVSFREYMDTKKVAQGELSAVCAVAFQYEYLGHSHQDASKCTPFYAQAKMSLDLIFQRNSLRAMRMCTLLAIYNMIAKSVLALHYSDWGISLGSRLGLSSEQRPPSVHEHDSTRYTKIFKVLHAVQSLAMASLEHTPYVGAPLYKEPEEIISRQPRTALIKGFEAFFVCTGSLFHCYSLSERQILQNTFLKYFNDINWTFTDNQSTNEELKLVLAEISGMAAVGLMNTRDALPGMNCAGFEHDRDSQYQGLFYDNAKAFLETVIKFNSQRAIKLCAILSLYNISARSTVSLAYADSGISLGIYNNLHNDKCPTNLSQDDYRNYRRVLRTLLTVRNWLVASLGYAADPHPSINMVNNHENTYEGIDVEDKVQQQLANLTIIKSHFIRTATQLSTLSPSLLRSMKDDLTTWHSNVPHWMQLHYLITHPEESPAQRRVILIMHLFYLSAVSFTARIVLAHWHDRMVNSSTTEECRVIFEAVESSRSSTRILNLLSEEGLLSIGPWLCIFSSYMSGVFLIYAITRRIQNRELASSWQGDEQLAHGCVEVLALFAPSNIHARDFHSKLQQALLQINSAELGNEGDVPVGIEGSYLDTNYLLPSLRGDEALHETTENMLDIMSRPFRKSPRVRTEMQIESEENTFRTNIDWSHEVGSPFNNIDIPSETSPNATSVLLETLSGARDGRFII